MRPTLQYIIEKFDYYNKLCFNGQLKMPPIKLNTRKAKMGITSFGFELDSVGNTIISDIKIEISIRQDLPEEEYIDTLIHEMIHYYILSNGLVDDSPHGKLFKAKMDEINNVYGIRVTIAFVPSEEVLVKTMSRNRFVCVAEFEDGQIGFVVVAKNKLFELWEYFDLSKKIQSHHWFVSNRAIFEKFPVSVSPNFIIVDADKLHHYLTGANELENIGQSIRIKQLIK